MTRCGYDRLDGLSGKLPARPTVEPFCRYVEVKDDAVQVLQNDWVGRIPKNASQLAKLSFAKDISRLKSAEEELRQLFLAFQKFGLQQIGTNEKLLTYWV